jgi:hypothetical protein
MRFMSLAAGADSSSGLGAAFWGEVAKHEDISLDRITLGQLAAIRLQQEHLWLLAAQYRALRQQFEGRHEVPRPGRVDEYSIYRGSCHPEDVFDPSSAFKARFPHHLTQELHGPHGHDPVSSEGGDPRPAACNGPQ